MINKLETKELAKQYFHIFSNKDLDGLSQIYSESVTLRDWDIDVAGKANVLAANQQLFDSVKTIYISPLELYGDGNTVASEIEIIIDGNQVLKVVDIIDFDKNGKIQHIRAYKA